VRGILPGNAAQARNCLLQPHDGNVTIRQTLPNRFMEKQALSPSRRSEGTTSGAGGPQWVSSRSYSAGEGELTGAMLPAGKTPAPESGAGEDPGKA
jgi:hypothetical protein